MTGRMNTVQMTTSFRTTPNTTGQQVNPVKVPQKTSCNTHPESCMYVHQPVSQVCKPGELLALRKVKHPLNGRTSVNRLPLTKQDILSQYSSCFEGIGCFPGDLYKFHLKPDYKPAQHAPRKVPVHLETAFKEKIESLVKQGILEEVKECTYWVNSYVIVEKDTGNHNSPNHTVKRKLRICLYPRDLNVQTAFSSSYAGRCSHGFPGFLVLRRALLFWGIFVRGLRVETFVRVLRSSRVNLTKCK